MNCTQCKTVALEPDELEPGLIAAVCPQCRGALLSLINYRFWADRYTDSDEADESVVGDIAEVESAHTCPKCSRLMIKYQIGTETQHKLDLCSACDEAWLDKGEWQLLKKLDLEGKLPKIFTDAWQRNIRKQRHETMINDRYEKMLGADSFTKSLEFKTWLYQQPNNNKEWIKQFLIIAPE